MPATLTSDVQRRSAFGNALAEAMRVRRITQAELGARLNNMRQPSISAWKSGEALPPDVETVFRIEAALTLQPGHLSRYLGFMPVDGMVRASTVRDAVMVDELLSESGRRILLSVYEELTSGPPTSPGRKPAKKAPAAKSRPRRRRTE